LLVAGTRPRVRQAGRGKPAAAFRLGCVGADALGVREEKG